MLFPGQPQLLIRILRKRKVAIPDKSKLCLEGASGGGSSDPSAAAYPRGPMPRGPPGPPGPGGALVKCKGRKVPFAYPPRTLLVLADLDNLSSYN